MSAEWREQLASGQKSLKKAMRSPKAGTVGKSSREKE